jgi:hypothetical protein
MHFTHKAPPESVSSALQEVAALGTFFTLKPEDPGTTRYPVDQTYPGGWPDLITVACARHRTPKQHIGASIMQLGHAARLWSPVLACTVIHGIVPDLDGLHRTSGEPDLGLPAVPTGWYAHGVPFLADALHDLVVIRHLDALAAGLPVKVSPRLLAGNTASALAEAARAVLSVRPDLRGPLGELVGELLTIGRLAGAGEITGPSLSFRRRTCCLYYRVPSGTKCDDCSLVT